MDAVVVVKFDCLGVVAALLVVDPVCEDAVAVVEVD